MASDVCNVSFQCSTVMRNMLDDLANRSGRMSRSEYILKILQKAVVDEIVIETEVRYQSSRETDRPRGLLGRKRAG